MHAGQTEQGGSGLSFPERLTDGSRSEPEPKKPRGGAAVTLPADGESWFDLFDLGSVEHICDAVRATILDRVHAGTPTGWQAENLRRFVLAPLDAYMAEHFDADAKGVQVHIEKARALFDVAERITELFADEYPFFAEDAPAWEERLLRAWIEFVAYGSAYRIYWDIPRRKAQAKAAASVNRSPIDVKAVVSFMRERKLVSMSDEQAEELGAMYPGDDGKPASVSTVRRRVKEARGKGLLPPK